MNLNIHGYDYTVNDVAYVIDQSLNIRKGTCVNVTESNGVFTYTFLMDDNNQQEQYSKAQLYPLYSHAEIEKNRQITPTPTISSSPTPAVTRTPYPTATASPTPTLSYVYSPNLLSGATWQTQNCTITQQSSTKILITSTSTFDKNNGLDIFALTQFGVPSPADLVEISTTVSVKSSSIYEFMFNFEQGTCRNVVVMVYDQSNNLLFKEYHSDSGYFSKHIKTEAATSLKVVYYFYSDNRFIYPTAEGKTFTLNNVSLKYNGVDTGYVPTFTAYDNLIMQDGATYYWPLISQNLDSVTGTNSLVLGDVTLKGDSYGNQLYSTLTNHGVTISTPFTATSSFSLEAWVYIRDLNNYHTIFGTSLYGLQFDGTTTPYNMWLYGNTDSVHCTYAFQANTYYHIVMTCDATKKILFYINGVLSDPAASITETYVFNMLADDGSNEVYSGLIGNPAFYNKVLTQQEVTNHYNAGLSGYRYSQPAPLPAVSPTPTPSITPTVTTTPAKYYGLFSSNGTAFTDTTIRTSGPIRNIANDANNIYASGYDMNALNGTPSNLYKLSSSVVPTSSISTSFNGLNGIITTADNRELWYGPLGTVQGITRSGLMAFDATGNVNTAVQYTIPIAPFDAILAADGKIYVCGAFTSVSGDSTKAYLFRLNNDFTIDNTFSITFTGTGISVSRLLQTADGKIYVSGTFATVNGSSYANLARLNSDGTLDTTFVNIGINAAATYMMQDTANKIYLTGTFTVQGVSYIARLNSDGTFDNTWTSPIQSTGGNISAMYEIGGNYYLPGYGYSGGYGNVLVLNSSGALGTPLTGLPTKTTTFYSCGLTPDKLTILLGLDVSY